MGRSALGLSRARTRKLHARFEVRLPVRAEDHYRLLVGPEREELRDLVTGHEVQTEPVR